MDEKKREALQQAGWQVGSTAEFLQLTPEESAYIELKLTLASNLRARRQAQNLTQVELAHLLQSSQSRIAKMEAGDPSVSLDLLIRSLLALGTTQKEMSLMFAA